ncbi:formyltransferase family protein [Pelagibius marinus]|uniref:formyltransferase family protein n=1 Tax=Pelagibius marinus TaxID=2762760 RepID=UPI001872A5C3|nr:formyltransferase family protein [Pelagibius marinus]
MSLFERIPSSEKQWRFSGIDSSKPADLRFAFLNLRDHPRGQLMLLELIRYGFVPELVIEEDSPLAEEGRFEQLQELLQTDQFESMEPTASLCARLGITHLYTTNHNNDESITRLRDGRFPLVILGDTRVLRPAVISTALVGIINVHPGVLPDVRGNTPYVWSIVHDLPQGATAHLVNTEVDRGPILNGRRLELQPGISYPQLLQELNHLCADVLVETLQAIVEKRAELTAQPDDDRLTFRKAPRAIKEVAVDMLRPRRFQQTASPSPSHNAPL